MLELKLTFLFQTNRLVSTPVEPANKKTKKENSGSIFQLVSAILWCNVHIFVKWREPFP